VCGEHDYSAHTANQQVRFIPTCVGNIYFCAHLGSFQPVHPHVCGEHARRLLDVLAGRRFIPTCVGNIERVKTISEANGGSSPRVWGTCFQQVVISHFLTVHPHVCGEHDLFQRPFRHAHRFIPTCVGNIEIAMIEFTPSPVHPHVCGEHFLALDAIFLRGGSSPRVWGTCTR